MSVTQKIVTSNFNVHNAKQFIESFSEVAPNDYFMFCGKHTPYANSDGTITVADNSIKTKQFQIYDDMIYAKRIQSTDIVHVIPNNKWSANTYFDMYDDSDGNLFEKDFYCVVNDNVEYNVYKCLFNNSNSTSNTNSTIAPSRVGSLADINPIITGDGYIWKYMYTISKTDYDKFATSAYIPITANTTVINNSTPGTIEVIKIDNGGKGYSNYISSGVFKVGDIKVNGIGTVYGAPATASGLDDYYKGCVLKITSGAGIDQYRRIIGYTGTGTQKTFVLDSQFTTSPSVNDTYEVYPYIYVWGDGSETTIAEARAIVSGTSNTITEIEMLNAGAGYRSGVAVPSYSPQQIPITINSTLIELPTIISNDVNFEQAELHPIISPGNGHGSDPYNELNGRRVCVSVKFTNSEGGTIPTENDFRQVGILKDPLFTNVDLAVNTSINIGSFVVGEKVHQFKQVKVLGLVDTVSGNNTIVKNNDGKISTLVSIANSGTRYDYTVNNQLIFDNTGTSGSGAEATFVSNTTIIVQANIQSNNSITSNFIALASANTTFSNGERVKYYTLGAATGYVGLANNQYVYVAEANTTGFKVSSSSSLTPTLTISSNTSDTGNVTFTVVNGAITSVTVTNQGNNYLIAPTVSVNAEASGHYGQILVSLANPTNTTYTDSFSNNDYVLVSNGTSNFLSQVNYVYSDTKIIAKSNASFTSSGSEMSALVLGASGIVKSVSVGQVTLSNVSGSFQGNSKIIGLTSGATTTINNQGVQINDKTAGIFQKTLQLTRLVGNYAAGQPAFVNDEVVYQDSFVGYAKPIAYLHHAEINGSTDDDVLYVSNEHGIFNLDSSGVTLIEGNTSGATLANISYKYPGDFVKGSGEVLYYENLDAITRSSSKSEIIKVILEF